MIGKKQTVAAVLGIAFEGSRVHISVVRRAGRSCEVLKSFAIELSGSPGHANASVLAQEIRQALQQHSIKERRCVVSLPVQWVLSLSVKIPELPEGDVPGFLDLEAERHFAYDPESLFVSSSRCRFASGESYANIAGVQREQLLNLQALLQEARLKPLSFTVGIAALRKLSVDRAASALLLVLGTASVEVGIACDEGLFAMRSLDNANADGQFDSDVIGRELRVTLGQLPAELRGQLVTARLFGVTEAVSQLKTELAPRLRAMGLAVESVDARSESAAGGAAAVCYLLGDKPDFEFLPPKVSAWKEFAGKAAARKLGWAASVAAALLVLLMIAFLVQGWRLSRLESRWAAMAPRVTDLEATQQRIKRFRPWFDNSFRSLSILRKLTEAFPADGVVTAKTLEVRNQSQVTCSGVARDNQALFKMLDQLRGIKEVADVKMEQIRGKSPLQFNFNFRWVEGGTGESQ